MARLNGIIAALENGGTAFGTFAPGEIHSAEWLTSQPYDGVVFEMEHKPWDIVALRDTLQYMLNRKQIVARGTVAPSVTPLVRIPANGMEKNQWLAKQALDIGVYGIVWPHVSTADQAYNAVSACRYPRPKTASNLEPIGQRGDSPTLASRYWGIDTGEYYKKADVWPLAPEGEILCVLMIEDLEGIDNLPEILGKVPGIGAVLIGEGDLSQELGHPRDYHHPLVEEAMGEIVKICKSFNVPVGHPHVGSKNVEHVLEQGYRLLLASPTRSFAALETGRKLAGRS